MRSMQGEFSRQVDSLVEQLIHLRLFVEAAIDFPEEEIDFLADGKISGLLHDVRKQLDSVLLVAQQGSLLQEGMRVVIAGAPNAGKSSLLNALSGQDRAIVTDIAGTTRDTLQATIHIDGLPLHVIDTAGLRDSPDEVEQIGIERAIDAIQDADQIVLLQDCRETQTPDQLWQSLLPEQTMPEHVTLVRNKVDLTGDAAGQLLDGPVPIMAISAKQGNGIKELRQYLKDIVGYQSTLEGGFSARRRHLDALQRASALLQQGADQLAYQKAGELLAEDLRLAQDCLSEITGQFTSDDLLGRIFGSFCIGK